MLTINQMVMAFPLARLKNLETHLPYINEAMPKYGINTHNRVDFFLAQVGHESGNFEYTEEIASGRAYEHRDDLGNLKRAALDAAHAKGSTTGRFYKGRGLIQITGYNNYRACGESLNIDLVNNPQLLSTTEYAALSAGWFWFANGLNEISDTGDFKRCTRRVNGGYRGFKDRKKHLVNVKEALGHV